MAFSHNPKIPTSGLVFNWNGLDKISWDGSSSSHKDLVSGATGTKGGANSLSLTNNHVSWTGNGDRVCVVTFNSSDITVPTGDEGTWIWASYFSDAGSIDHPNFGKETGSSWDGTNGFVFGTGWGTDGLRAGVGGTAYTPFDETGADTGDYRPDVWQMYAVTYLRNDGNGLKTYLHDSNGQRLVNTKTTSDSAIGSNSNALYLGATNSRGGNWNGNMDFVLMYNRVLTQDEIFSVFNNHKHRFGL